VYRLYRRFRRRRVAQKSAERIAKLFGLTIRNGTHPIRVFIDATSTADNKTKWRWTQALRFAWAERHAWTTLPTFVRNYGGAAGCAAECSARTAHPPAAAGRGWVLAESAAVNKRVLALATG
jgi:hypothetical protein